MTRAKKMVYIPQINPKTWMLMTWRNNTCCLRDYSGEHVEIDNQKTTNEIEQLLKNEGNRQEHLPAFTKIKLENYEFWKDQVRRRNISYGIEKFDKINRLQDDFKNECKPWIEKGKTNELVAVFENWTKQFSCIKEDRVDFNHYDNSSCDNFNHNIGIGWSAQLLEASREGKRSVFMNTREKKTDFCTVAMELSFGISSTNNLFNPKRTDFIKPDGLAVRRNGRFTVVEVKGPQDEKSLIPPLLQAVCGVLAVIAKRKMIINIASKPGLLRPEVSNACIDPQKRNIGIHLLLHGKPDGGPRKTSREKWDEKIEQQCELVLSACKALEYIAYSFVTTEGAKDLPKNLADMMCKIKFHDRPWIHESALG